MNKLTSLLKKIFMRLIMLRPVQDLSQDTKDDDDIPVVRSHRRTYQRHERAPSLAAPRVARAVQDATQGTSPWDNLTVSLVSEPGTHPFVWRKPRRKPTPMERAIVADAMRMKLPAQSPESKERMERVDAIILPGLLSARELQMRRYARDHVHGCQ